MNENRISLVELKKVVLSRFLMAIFALGVLFFLPAWTFVYWQAWVYLVLLSGFMFSVLRYLLKNDPDLLARRMKFKEKEAEQKLIVKLSFIPFLLAFVIPGLDVRFGWSNLSWGVVIAADILAFFGYIIVILVFRENRYASRVVEVEEEQTVIQSGPYARVRHPMYVGVLLLYIFSPLALGSWWAVLPALITIPVIVARILNEEKVLVRDLKGYPEYMQKVRWRLIPGIW